MISFHETEGTSPYLIPLSHHTTASSVKQKERPLVSHNVTVRQKERPLVSVGAGEDFRGGAGHVDVVICGPFDEEVSTFQAHGYFAFGEAV